MTRFLTPEWTDALIAALNACDEVADVDLTLQQVVTGAPDGEFSYWTSFTGGTVEGGVGRASQADVTITQDYDTAAAMSRGEINAQAAFMQGKLKVTGNMGKLLQQQAAIAALGPVMASIETEY